MGNKVKLSNKFKNVKDGDTIKTQRGNEATILKSPFVGEVISIERKLEPKWPVFFKVTVSSLDEDFNNLYEADNSFQTKSFKKLEVGDVGVFAITTMKNGFNYMAIAGEILEDE